MQDVRSSPYYAIIFFLSCKRKTREIEPLQVISRVAWKNGIATDCYILPFFPLGSRLPRTYTSHWGWPHSGMGGLTARLGIPSQTSVFRIKYRRGCHYLYPAMFPAPGLDPCAGSVFVVKMYMPL